MTAEDPMVIWERKKAIKAAERAVIAAAERFATSDPDYHPVDMRSAALLGAIEAAVSALREARGE